LPFCHAELRASRPQPSRYPKEINTLGDHIRARRLDLHLLQSEVAKQIGVHNVTVHNWESNASVPAIRYIPAVLHFLGYNPLLPGQTLIERLVAARKVLGMSQRELALAHGVDEATWRGWEAREHQPIGRNVELIERFLRTCESPATPEI
jgi:DNA-binding transcriptional regulator YiaG